MADDGARVTAAEGAESVEALIGQDTAAEPTLPPAWEQGAAAAAKQGRLILYLGAAPGVGKTFAMLSEGRRRAARGTDVVVAWVETYGRPRTIEMTQGLERVAPRAIEYRDRRFEEMDADAVIQRGPEVALVDELAHTNIPGSRRGKRWEDVIDLLVEGMTVISTVNIQHLESLNDVVADVTGIRQRETVPDWVVDLADQVELVDMSPYALQRRMMHGNIYPDQHKAELALNRFFTTENLTALRELALMRVADQVDETLLSRWSGASTPDTRERVLVLVSHPEFSEDLVRRGARIAQRARGDLLVLHVRERDDEATRSWLTSMKQVVSNLGGEFHVIDADDAVDAALGFAYRQFVTQVVVGEPLRSKWTELVRGSFVTRLIRRAHDIDITVFARQER